MCNKKEGVSAGPNSIWPELGLLAEEDILVVHNSLHDGTKMQFFSEKLHPPEKK